MVLSVAASLDVVGLQDHPDGPVANARRVDGHGTGRLRADRLRESASDALQGRGLSGGSRQGRRLLAHVHGSRPKA